MFKNSFIIATVTVVIGLFAVSSFAQRATPGPMQPWGGGTSTPAAAPAAASSTPIYAMNGGQFFGRLTAYDANYYEIIPAAGGIIKSYSNTCKRQDSNGVPGNMCVIAYFDNQGQHTYSGYAWFGINANVYIEWTNQNYGGFWRQYQTDWLYFRP
jgi:hypothetical protein